MAAGDGALYIPRSTETAASSLTPGCPLAAATAIIARNPQFALGANPRAWHGGDPALTAFFNGMSLLFPDGEAFFIDSVKELKPDDLSPALAADIRGFIAQESIHRREHMRYNAGLEAHGYPCEAIAKRSRMAWARRIFSPLQRLALTAAMEHYTALSSRLLLADPRLLQGAEESYRRFWRWHALEELEHRAVAFDVYRAAGPRGLRGYGLRVLMMLVATVFFTGRLFANTHALLRADGRGWSARMWGRILYFLFLRPAVVPRLILPYLGYFRPGFHPSDHDVAALIERARGDYDAAPAAAPPAPPEAAIAARMRA